MSDFADKLVREPRGGAPRRLRTRQALLDAGLKLMANQPIDAIAIDEIVRAAGVAKGSFFNHFRDKDQFADAVASQVRTEIEQAIGALNRDVEDPAQCVARAVCLYILCAVRDPRRASVLLRSSSRLSRTAAPLNRGVLADVSRGLMSGRFAVPTVDAGVLMVLGVAQIALARVLDEPNKTVGAALGQQLCALLLRGLGLNGAEAETIAARAAHEVIEGTAPSVALLAISASRS